MQSPAIPFRKMNGLGNDFVVLDARPRALALAPDAVRAIADRKAGIGCDQIIALEPSRNADVFMRIWNAEAARSAPAAMPRAAWRRWSQRNATPQMSASRRKRRASVRR